MCMFIHTHTHIYIYTQIHAHTEIYHAQTQTWAPHNFPGEGLVLMLPWTQPSEVHTEQTISTLYTDGLAAKLTWY